VHVVDSSKPILIKLIIRRCETCKFNNLVVYPKNLGCSDRNFKYREYYLTNRCPQVVSSYSCPFKRFFQITKGYKALKFFKFIARGWWPKTRVTTIYLQQGWCKLDQWSCLVWLQWQRAFRRKGCQEGARSTNWWRCRHEC
jgi:hypothetical protein